MDEDKLLIITRLKKTYEYTLKSLENYPHKYLELKKHIDTTILEMIELCYIANYGCKVEENKILAISKLSMVDYYLKLSYKNEIISKKKYESISKHLLEIQLMLKSWLNINEKSE
ncbi:MAG: four helix bundle protein [Clostridia bacterium]|nr:four helix bundle protein [Clostridia bacterium]